MARIIPFLMPIPALLIGVLTMFMHHISVFIWGQNLLLFILSALISSIVLGKHRKRSSQPAHAFLVMVTSMILLLLTFLSPGDLHVFRWIAIGTFQLHIAFIVLPTVILALHQILPKNFPLALFFILAVAMLLLFQPDASHLTAFSVCACILLGKHLANRPAYLGILALLFFFCLYSWLNLDALPPVSYVENIMVMVADMGLLWAFAGIISLLLFPLSFCWVVPAEQKKLALCLGGYYYCLLLAACFGNFPIPFMGYGVSPIIGYFIALTYLLKQADRINLQKGFRP